MLGRRGRRGGKEGEEGEVERGVDAAEVSSATSQYLHRLAADQSAYCSQVKPAYEP